MRTAGLLFLLAIATVPAGCGGGSGLTAPGALPRTTPLAVFVDLDTGFSTTDVRDAQDQIVQFTTGGELLWAADGSRYPNYRADGRVVTADGLCTGCYFFVRFGVHDGERRAYLTWATPVTAERPATVLDLDVVAGAVVARDTDMVVPSGS